MKHLIVKHNYGPEGVSDDGVLSNPVQHLGSTTVMLRRETGLDPDNLKSFWRKDTPDGTLELIPTGIALVGRVAKGRSRLHRVPLSC